MFPFSANIPTKRWPVITLLIGSDQRDVAAFGWTGFRRSSKQW